MVSTGFGFAPVALVEIVIVGDEHELPKTMFFTYFDGLNSYSARLLLSEDILSSFRQAVTTADFALSTWAMALLNLDLME